MPRLERLAAAGLVLVLIVVAASAAIRLGADAVPVLRMAHRSAASGAVAIVGALAWIAWRSRRARAPVGAAAVLIALLALVGAAGGRNPPFAVSMTNIVGGLALAAAFAWLAGVRAAHRPGLALLVLLQCALGAWLSLAWHDRPLALLIAHALLGLALAVTIVGLAARLERAAMRAVLVALAVAVPAAGATAAFLDRALAPSLAHACTVALLVAALVYAHSRAA